MYVNFFVSDTKNMENVVRKFWKGSIVPAIKRPKMPKKSFGQEPQKQQFPIKKLPIQMGRCGHLWESICLKVLVTLQEVHTQLH